METKPQDLAALRGQKGTHRTHTTELEGKKAEQNFKEAASDLQLLAQVWGSSLGLWLYSQWLHPLSKLSAFFEYLLLFFLTLSLSLLFHNQSSKRIWKLFCFWVFVSTGMCSLLTVIWTTTPSGQNRCFSQQKHRTKQYVLGYSRQMSFLVGSFSLSWL